MRIVHAHSSRLEAMGREILLIVRGDPEGDLRRRTLAGCARCYVLATDRPLSRRKTLWSLTDESTEARRRCWGPPYDWRICESWRIRRIAGRKAVLGRIAQGNLGIEDRLGPWNGSFWAGLRASGAIRRGPGTEWRVWERSHGELIADLSEMPLMHRLEPRAARHGQRRLRRCYAPFLPAEQSTEPSLLAGLFAGAAMREDAGEQWLELPDTPAVRSLLDGWGIPAKDTRRNGRGWLWVSPLFAMLVVHLMPPRSAGRMLAIRKAGGCPFLAVVLWQMAMTAKGRRYMPFPDALPFGISKATFFRRRWRRRDLNKIGWLDLHICVTPKLREVMVEWFGRCARERAGRAHEPETHPPSPEGMAP